VAVNLSVQTLADPELPRFLRDELLGREDRDPTRLVVEITEHAAMRQDEVTDHNLDVLREEVGLSLSIDDFGTGYSSLLYLRRLPADYLKVDMTFVRGLGRSARDEKVVRAIIALGEEFDMRVIGEGVETEAQGRWLREAGCHHLQGFHYGRPVPGEEL
jgi:EAL domain-containing protein (putative c-di-GMP-specific phosphodiesterase class I)